jgi:bacterioferritin-associated ferredoxin
MGFSLIDWRTADAFEHIQFGVSLSIHAVRRPAAPHHTPPGNSPAAKRGTAVVNGIDNHSHSRSNNPMIVCVCKAVSDKHIRSAVKQGASCMRDLTRELQVGTCCGKCVPEARAALAACLEDCSTAPTSFFGGSNTGFAV